MYDVPVTFWQVSHFSQGYSEDHPSPILEVKSYSFLLQYRYLMFLNLTKTKHETKLLFLYSIFYYDISKTINIPYASM